MCVCTPIPNLTFVHLGPTGQLSSSVDPQWNTENFLKGSKHSRRPRFGVLASYRLTFYSHENLLAD